MESSYVGIDISKKNLDVDLGEIKNYENNLEGIQKLIKELKKRLKKKQLMMVICEPTGG